MLKDHPVIQCEGHGEAYATYVCAHLAADPVQQWFGLFPEDDNPWPDAWCSGCNAIFLREGEWNEESEKNLGIKMICDACYSDARSRSVDHLQGTERARWDEFVRSCCADLEKKQEQTIRELELDKHKRWDWEQDTAQLTFSNDGIPAVVADIEFVGSVSDISHTWLWAWANFSLADNVRGRVTKVRDLGEREGFPHLTTAKWTAREHDGWHMAAVAAHVLGAIGVYRTPDEKGATFLALMSARKA